MTRSTTREVLRPLSALVFFLALVAPAAGQDETPQTGLEFAGIPALNYDSDEGFGYGAVVELYDYGEGGYAPYRWTLQPLVFLTTEGRRDISVFYDSPHLLPAGWRIDASASNNRHIATPYYGVGNDAPFDETLTNESDPYYYRYGTDRWSAAVNLQKSVYRDRLRVLFGGGARHVSLVTVPEATGTTLLAQELAAADAPVPGGWSNYVRAGVVWDTRDRETGPRSGTWTEFLVQRVDELLGSESSYTRWTFADRRYFSLNRRLVFANRILMQDVSGDPPFYVLSEIQTSFKQQEGMGGLRSIRGVQKNRFVGKGLFLWNAELRWRVADFRMLGKPFHTVLSAFVDSGRVWAEGVQIGEIFTDLHHGFGGGVRLGMGENFVISLDVGTSAETTAPFYINLGYLF
jgi:outer membrane protein assembly factor BamA